MDTSIDRPKAERTRRDSKTIEGLLADYGESGLSQVGFARERGLNVGTFRGWLYRRRKNRTDGLCEVVLRRDSGHADKAVALVRMPNGSEVELPLCASLAWVERVIRKLVQG